MRMSSSSHLSPPPSPHSAPLPLSSSSSLTRCPELDLSVTLGSAHTHLKPRPLKTRQQNDQSQLKPSPQGQMGRKGNIQVCLEEPVVVTVTAEQSRDAPPQQPIRGQRRSRGCSHGGAPRQWVEPPAAVSNQDPGYLERAGLNTTLALKAELQSLQGAEFNSQKAVQEMLRRSERTKNLINTRATEEVNVSELKSERLSLSASLHLSGVCGCSGGSANQPGAAAEAPAAPLSPWQQGSKWAIPSLLHDL